MFLLCISCSQSETFKILRLTRSKRLVNKSSMDCAKETSGIPTKSTHFFFWNYELCQIKTNEHHQHNVVLPSLHCTHFRLGLKLACRLRSRNIFVCNSSYVICGRRLRRRRLLGPASEWISPHQFVPSELWNICLIVCVCAVVARSTTISSHELNQLNGLMHEIPPLLWNKNQIVLDTHFKSEINTESRR